MYRKSFSVAGLVVALLIFSSGCVTNGYVRGMRGTVESVDVRSNSIFLTNIDAGSGERRANGGTARVRFDADTEVSYRGAQYRPEDLEAGDVVDVRLDDSDSELVADGIVVVRSVSDRMSSRGDTYRRPADDNRMPPPTDQYGDRNPPPDRGMRGDRNRDGDSLRGTLRFVDAARHMFVVDAGNGRNINVDFDERTIVSYNGRAYRPTDLEPGDQIDVRISQSGGRVHASGVMVMHSVRDGADDRMAPQRNDAQRNGGQRNDGQPMNNHAMGDPMPAPPMNGAMAPHDVPNDAPDQTINGSTNGSTNDSMNEQRDDAAAHRDADTQSTIQGTVQSVDTGARTIELQGMRWTAGGNRGAANRGGSMTINYDTGMVVEFSGRTYPVSGLQRGDVVDVQVSRSGTMWMADRITVVHDVNQH